MAWHSLRQTPENSSSARTQGVENLKSLFWAPWGTSAKPLRLKFSGEHRERLHAHQRLLCMHENVHMRNFGYGVHAKVIYLVCTRVGGAQLKVSELNNVFLVPWSSTPEDLPHSANHGNAQSRIRWDTGLWDLYKYKHSSAAIKYSLCLPPLAIRVGAKLCRVAALGVQQKSTAALIHHELWSCMTASRF